MDYYKIFKPYINTLNKYNIKVNEDVKKEDLYDILEEILYCRNVLTYSDDEDSMMDITILESIIDTLDDYDFE